MEPPNDVTSYDWKVLVYDETGYVLINTIIKNKTSAEIESWRAANENDTWAQVLISHK